MNLNLLALFLLAKLASSEIEDSTSLIQRSENNRYTSPRFLYVPTNFDEYEEENLEESLVNTQKYENEDETSPQWPEDNNYMLPKFLEVPTALDDYEFYEYEYSGDYEDFEDESLEDFLANLEKDFDKRVEERLANLEKNKSWIDKNSYTFLILVLLGIIATLGLLWCISNKFCRDVEDMGAVGAMGTVGAVGAIAPIDWAAVGAVMDPIDLDISLDAVSVDFLVTPPPPLFVHAEVVVAPPDFSKTVNAMSARGA